MKVQPGNYFILFHSFFHSFFPERKQVFFLFYYLIRLILITEHDIKKLTTNVRAIIGGLPLPFIGVDGTSACSNLYLEDGVTKTRCPLKAGQNYVYKNSFDVLPVYPSISQLDVHWALVDGNDKDLACFQLPARIL